jgi:hypothetical protein
MLGLKGFHIFFICVSILLCLMVGGWGFQQYSQAGSTAGLALAIVFFLSGGALVVYAVRYFGKLRNLDRKP